MQKNSTSSLDHDVPVTASPSLPTGEAAAIDDVVADQQKEFISDAELLKRFIRSRDPVAFSMLVQRHQRLVMGVALRQVGDRHRAEDVFQATFLILAEQAKKIRKPNSLASWLHGTARRIGLRALSESQKHPVPSTSDLSQTPDTAMPDPALEKVEDAFEKHALDEELSKLPEQLREPLVLHYLDGLTGREVAERLGLTVDTVEGRLKRGRHQLRTRLMRRGIGFGIVLAAFQMSQQAAVAATTSTLVSETTASAVAWVSQQTLQGCSANAAHLAGKELATMTAMKMTTMLACTAVICLTGGAISAMALDLPITSGTGNDPGHGDAIQTSLIAQAEPSGGATPVEVPAEDASGSAGSTGDYKDKYEIEYGRGGSLPIYPDPSNPNAAKIHADSMRSINNTIGTHIENRTYRKMSPSRKAVEEKLDSEIAFGATKISTLTALEEELLKSGIPVKIDLAAIEDEGLSIDQEGLAKRFDTPGMTLRDNLAIMLEPLDLTYIVKNGVLTITTETEASNYHETVVYEVRHLGANLPSEDVAALVLDIPDSYWIDHDGEGGSVRVIPGGIVVSQTQATHRKIVQLLEQLEDFAAKSDLPQVQRDPTSNTPHQFIGEMGGYNSGGAMGGENFPAGGGQGLF